MNVGRGHGTARPIPLGGVGLSSACGAAALLLLGCHAERAVAPTPPAPTDSVHVSLALPSVQIHPGDDLTFTVTVTAPGTAVVTDAKVVFSGLFADTMELAVPGPGSFRYYVTVHSRHAPIAGREDILAVARLNDVADTARATFEVVDDGPPQLRVLVFNAPPQPGDTMKVGFIADDAAGIARMAYTIAGGVTGVGSASYSDSGEVAAQVLQYVPPNARLGDSVAVTLTVWDGFGQSATGTLRARLADLTAPIAQATVSPGAFDSLLPWRAPVHFVGDTLQLGIVARDNLKVAWVGWRITGLALGDSSLVMDSGATRTWRVAVTDLMDGPGRSLVLFARDSSGNVTERSFGEDFVAGTRRAFQVLPPGALALNPPSDYVYSPSLGLALVAGIGSVTAFSIQPFAQVGLVTLGTNAFGVDFEPGGDTAWTGAVLGPTLSRIELTQTPVTVVSTLRLPITSSARSLRVTADDRAVITEQGPSGVAFVDLRTGLTTQQAISGLPPFETASQDRTALLAYDGNGGAMLYRTATDSFTPYTAVAPGRPSLDAHGTMVLIDNQLYDGNLRFQRYLGPPAYDGVASVLTADGQYAYFAKWPGYHKLRVADGSLVEKVFLPEIWPYLIEMPDRSRLLLIGQFSITLVDLSPGGGGAASMR